MNPPRSRRPGGRPWRVGALAALAGAVSVALIAAWFVATRPEPAPYSGQALFPAPQHLTGDGADLDFSGRVTLVAPDDADPAARAALTTLLGEVARQVVTASSAPEEGSDAGTVVVLGTRRSGGGPLEDALRGLGRPALDGQRTAALGRPEGYVIATGTFRERPTAVLAGADARGSFYAVQSLRRLLEGSRLTAVSVADWPLMRSRGVIEGFYGFPWDIAARTAVLDAMGQSKMNTFIYSPKDDPYARQRWREPYPDDGLGEIRALVDAAQRNHVDVSYALSPGLDICYSRDSELDAAMAKLEPLHGLGVRSFVIPFDDIGGALTCAADRQRFPGAGAAPLAQAQAWFLNRLRDRLEDRHPDLAPLQMVPTHYHGSGTDRYKAKLAEALDPRIIVQWTGEEIVSHRITSASAQKARDAYGTPDTPRTLLVWDNFPVNDFAQDRLFLGPVEGRDEDLHEHLLGMVSNPMIQPYASLPGIATYADMLWNAPAYRPYDSLDAALQALAGGDAEALEALRAFTDLNQNWQLDDLPHPAPRLTRDVEAYWSAYHSGAAVPSELGQRAALLRRLPELLPRLAEPGYAVDVAAWSAAAARYGDAMESALEMLEAVGDGDTAAAGEARAALLEARDAAVVRAQPTLNLGAVVPVTGDGVVQAFLDGALHEYDRAQ